MLCDHTKEVRICVSMHGKVVSDERARLLERNSAYPALEGLRFYVLLVMNNQVRALRECSLADSTVWGVVHALKLLLKGARTIYWDQ